MLSRNCAQFLILNEIQTTKANLLNVIQKEEVYEKQALKTINIFEQSWAWKSFITITLCPDLEVIKNFYAQLR